MIKALIFFAILLGIALGGSWLADRPGRILIEWPWLDTGFDISLLLGFLLLVAAMVVAVILWVVIRGIWRTPKSVSGFFSSRRRDKGYKALSTGMIAVGVGDLSLATKQAKKARKLLGEEPMTLMLEAQTAQLAGDVTKARQSFETMLDQDETRALGRRGLYIEAQRRGDIEEAMAMARAASDDSGKTPGWAGSALFDMQTAAHDWQGALITLSENYNSKHVTKDVFRRYRAVILTAQAMELDGETDALQTQKTLLQEAIKLAPGLVAAAVKAAEVLAELGDPRKAAKVIEAAWRIEPHPELARAYAYVKSGDSALERLKRIRSLYALKPDHLESKIAMARACLDAREWAEARSLIEPLAAAHLTPRLCMLMAELEEGEKNDFGLVRQWLARAVGAHRDPVWVADGQVSESWQPISPVTGKLDAFEWKVPVHEVAQANQPLIDSEELAAAKEEDEPEMVLIPTKDGGVVDITEIEPEEVEPEASDKETEAKADTVKEDAPAQNASDEKPEAKPEATKSEPAASAASKDEAEKVAPVKDVKDAKPDDKPAETSFGSAPAKTSETGGDGATKDSAAKASPPKPGKPREVEFPLPHAPDDPGPKKAPAEAHREKRFKLF